jgi:hypothetical protein
VAPLQRHSQRRPGGRSSAVGIRLLQSVPARCWPTAEGFSANSPQYGGPALAKPRWSHPTVQCPRFVMKRSSDDRSSGRSFRLRSRRPSRQVVATADHLHDCVKAAKGHRCEDHQADTDGERDGNWFHCHLFASSSFPEPRSFGRSPGAVLSNATGNYSGPWEWLRASPALAALLRGIRLAQLPSADHIEPLFF